MRVIRPAPVETALRARGRIGPQSGKLAKQIDAEGPDSPAVEARIDRILFAARVDLLVLVSIVFLMVTKVGQ